MTRFQELIGLLAHHLTTNGAEKSSNRGASKLDNCALKNGASAPLRWRGRLIDFEMGKNIATCEVTSVMGKQQTQLRFVRPT